MYRISSDTLNSWYRSQERCLLFEILTKINSIRRLHIDCYRVPHGGGPSHTHTLLLFLLFVFFSSYFSPFHLLHFAYCAKCSSFLFVFFYLPSHLFSVGARFDPFASLSSLYIQHQIHSTDCTLGCPNSFVAYFRMDSECRTEFDQIQTS